MTMKGHLHSYMRLIILGNFLMCMIMHTVWAGTASHLKHLSKGERKKAEEKALPNQIKLHKFRENYIQQRDAADYIEKYFIVKNMVNPSFARIEGDRVFICWRTGLLKGSHLKYGYLNLDDLSNYSAENRTSHNLIESPVDFPFAPYFQGLGVPRQNEVRILQQMNGRVSFTYAGNVKYKHVTQHISYAHMDPKRGISFDRNVYWMQYSGDQKNWVPFDYQSEIYFVQQYQPMHVVTIDKNRNRGSNIVSMKTVSRSFQRDQLPWNTTLFGSSIRGGTQAILLPDKTRYLSFFHTSVINPPDKIILTYFIGALLFDTKPPFNILAMSEVPIYKPDIYQGTWTRGGLDYVVFPTTMFISSNNQSLWLCAGHQDRDGIIMKFNLNGLLASLKPVYPGKKDVSTNSTDTPKYL